MGSQVSTESRAPQPGGKSAGRHVLDQLDKADREFIVRFVLASGSLKEVAKGYGVSYPTLRARLDRLIARLEVLRSGQPVNPMGELLAQLVERGELTSSAAKRIFDEHRKQLTREEK